MSIPSPLPLQLPDTEPVRKAASAPHSTKPNRWFHGATRQDVDEAVLQRWWQTLGDVVLDRFVEACLKQNTELSLASLRVSEVCAGLTGTWEDMATQPDCLKAWSLFHSLRVRLVAATVRVYLDTLEFQERLICTDLAISVQSTLLQHGRVQSMHRTSGSSRTTGLSELHLHRAHLQGERDAAASGLAWLTGEPLDLVMARIDGRLLPRVTCAMPATGTSDDLQLRRPDLLAITVLPADARGFDARADAVRREQALDRAICEVERALAALTASISQSAPARAAALAAGNRAGTLIRTASPSPTNHEAMVEANRLYHAFCDREIQVRASGYRALANLFEALGAGWPAPIETGEAR